MAEEIQDLWDEFEEKKTNEAKFCDAMDKLEPVIHWLDMKSYWKKHGFDEKGLREKKEAAMKEFPALLDFWNKMIDYLKKENTSEQ